MKILVLGGYTRSLLNFRGELMREMLRRNYEVVACGPENDEPTVEELGKIGVSFRQVPLARTGTNPLRDLRTIRELERIFREEAPQKLLAYTIKPVIYGTLAAARARVPERYAMITGLGSSFDSGHVVNAAVKTLYRRSLSRATRIIVQNPDDRDDLVRMRLADVSQFDVVNGSGVDCAHFAPSPLPDAAPMFLMISRVLAEKGTREFAEAARIVRKAHPEARFVLLGPLDTSPSAIAEQEVLGWVREGILDWRSGWTSDVRPALSECSVFVLPSSYREGTPRSILEALAMGRPVVTTDAPGCRETIQDGVQGFLVEPKSGPSLANALARFLNDPGLIETMGRAARERAVNKYDVHLINDHMLRIMGVAA